MEPKKFDVLSILLLGLLAGTLCLQPIKPHPSNPHYFLFRQKPAILITSTEHYGAVLNLDFDYTKYLDTLAAEKFTLTRTSTGAFYREIEGTFTIKNNTFAPKPNRYAAPFARSSECCYKDGGNKFNLSMWDNAYLVRLHDFVSKASDRGIVVEFDLTNVFYNEDLWELSPWHPSNNVNNLGSVTYNELYILKYDTITQLQRTFITLFVTELNAYDNVFYEIMNEPYWGEVTQAWQDFVTATIVQTESKLPNRHMIVQNVANGVRKVTSFNKDVSVINFHYSNSECVRLNYDLGIPLGDDETGFNGYADLPYRQQGWAWIIAGGALYDNLDYTFTAGHEDGSAPMGLGPGGGSVPLRKSLTTLVNFINSFDFISMTPDDSIFTGAMNGTGLALVNQGLDYAIYIYGISVFNSVVSVSIHTGPGTFVAQWIDVMNGGVLKEETIQGDSGISFNSPSYHADDIAVSIRRWAG